MLCPNCKKEIPDGTQFCPECGVGVNTNGKPAKQKKPITKKWWFWVIIVVVVIALISGVSGGDDSSDTNADSDNAVVEQNDSGTTTEIAAETTTEAGDGKYHVGDVLNYGDVAITYVAAEKWTGYDQYSKPASGNMVIRIKIDVKNNSSSDYYISPYEFACYADNQPASEYWYADDELSTVTLSSGRSASGYVYFEVPENAESIEIEYETNFWTDEKAVFVVEL